MKSVNNDIERSELSFMFHVLKITFMTEGQEMSAILCVNQCLVKFI